MRTVSLRYDEHVVTAPAKRQSSPAWDLHTIMPDAILASSGGLGWRSLQIFSSSHPPHAVELPAFEHHLVVVHLGPDARVMVTAGDARFDGRVESGAVSVIPAGEASTWRYVGADRVEALYVFLAPAAVLSAAAACGLDEGLVALEATIAVVDEQLRHVGMSLLYELGDAHLVGGLYADALAGALAAQLVKRYSVLRTAHLSRGGIAPRKLRRALELMSEGLGREGGVALADVAAAAGMSYFYFFRAFKRSMGVSPNRWVAERRVERAKRLLEDTSLPIAEIALRVGFASQSHFTTTFRRLAGSTPGAYRTLL